MKNYLHITLVASLGSFLLVPDASAKSLPRFSHNNYTVSVTTFCDRSNRISLNLQNLEPINEEIILSNNSIQIIKGKLILSNSLQHELNSQIALAKKELENRLLTLSINYQENISIHYFHQGQNHWQVKFTFGGIILKTSEDIILSTERIFRLKKVFERTKIIKIEPKVYLTTGSMTQLGPILHEGRRQPITDSLKYLP
jgi:hypothetical protein